MFFQGKLNLPTFKSTTPKKKKGGESDPCILENAHENLQNFN